MEHLKLSGVETSLSYGDLCNRIETRKHLAYSPGKLTFTELLREVVNLCVVVSYTVHPWMVVPCPQLLENCEPFLSVIWSRF